jgi:1-deoxy-D-xylulose-5-phosphate reductoisomerase
MKRIALLGSTGSIGDSALKVIEAAPDKFKIVALAGGKNYKKLAEHISKHNPILTSVFSEKEKEKLALLVPDYKGEILTGEKGLCRVAAMMEADIILMAVSGAAALAPVLAAASFGKVIALANKECLVMAGEMVMETASRNDAIILPVDSEHSGVFQALAERPVKQVRRIILPASGGPFLDKSLDDLKNVTIEDALNHPTWSMGQRITIDSATLMNKALEVIEARWLFRVDPDTIDVVIHPESVIHGMVEFIDGSVVAQMSVPDMRYPILRALTWPDRMDIGLPYLDFGKLGQLNFREVDHDRFPSLGLAYKALKMGGTATTVLASADEEIVEAFLKGKIPFHKIVTTVGEILDSHTPEKVDSIETAKQADKWAREQARSRTS